MVLGKDRDMHWAQPLIHRLQQKGPSRRVVAIAGPSGVGKSTLAGHLANRLNQLGISAQVLAMDDFFHGPAQRAQFNEWGPDHVRLDALQAVLKGFKAGQASLQTQRYVRAPKKCLLPWRLDFEKVAVLVFEGLYALSHDPQCGALGRFADMGLFLDASESLRKQWRFTQEAQKPQGRDKETMEQHWRLGIVPDTRLRVAPSRVHADWVFEKDVQHRMVGLSQGATTDAQTS